MKKKKCTPYIFECVYIENEIFYIYIKKEMEPDGFTQI